MSDRFVRSFWLALALLLTARSPAVAQVRIKPGQKRTVEFALGTADLAFYNERGQLVTEPGAFQVWVAPDSTQGLRGEFRVTE